MEPVRSVILGRGLANMCSSGGADVRRGSIGSTMEQPMCARGEVKTGPGIPFGEGVKRL